MTNSLFAEIAPEVKPLGIIDQIKKALLKKNRLAMLAGFVLGGFVPTASYTLAHFEVAAMPLLWILVTGGLIYSAKTVYDWASIAFGNPIKAVGFVVLIEGVMTFATTYWLSIAALCLLVAVNGIATGCNLVLDQKSVESEKAPRKPRNRTKSKRSVKAASPVTELVPLAA